MIGGYGLWAISLVTVIYLQYPVYPEMPFLIAHEAMGAEALEGPSFEFHPFYGYGAYDAA